MFFLKPKDFFFRYLDYLKNIFNKSIEKEQVSNCKYAEDCGAYRQSVFLYEFELFLIPQALIGKSVNHLVIIFPIKPILISLISKYFYNSIFTRFAGVLTGCALFFIITNFGVWTLGSYGYTFEGLIACYILAIPFFGNTIMGDLTYCAILFGAYEYIKLYVPRLATR